MADRAVDLPKPNPDDDEDVVDWLSTARTLWARGERSDALVWLRRAAEAAAMAGQPFRASEIGMYVTALEETYGDLPAAPPPVAAAPPAPEPERRGIADTLVDSVEAFGALATEVLRSKMTSIEVELDDDTLIEETPAALKPDPPEKPSRPRGVPPPPPPPKHASGNAPSAAAPSAPAAAPSARRRLLSSRGHLRARGPQAALSLRGVRRCRRGRARLRRSRRLREKVTKQR